MKFKHLRSRPLHHSRLRFETLERRNLLAGDICHNFVEAGDVNLDGNVSALDAVVLINQLSLVVDSPTEVVLADAGETEWLLDVDDNGTLSINDALQVVNQLSQEGYETRVQEEGLSELATAILMEDLPAGMHVNTAHEWFAKLHEKRGTPLLRRGAFDHLDGNGDGELTKDELSDVHWRRISDSDSDATGRVTRDEIKAARPSEHMLALLPNDARPHFESLDADQDGRLSEYEVAENLWDRIGDADVNEDGFVSFVELQEMRAERKLQINRHRDLFERFDANDDGLLVAEELPERLWNKFAEADLNEDGAISGDEFAEIKKTKRGGMGRHDRGDLFERFDENEDGFLTEDEVHARVWDKINQTDGNADGAISIDELQRLWEPEITVCAAPVLDRVFAQFDENIDGVLTENEVGDQLWRLIVRADLDQDGRVSLMELQDSSDAWGPFNPDRLEGLFIKFDLDGDGELAVDEVKETFWALFEQVDQNQDSVVSLEEIFTALKNADQSLVAELMEVFSSKLYSIDGLGGLQLSLQNAKQWLPSTLPRLLVKPDQLARFAQQFFKVPDAKFGQWKA
ncbi:MAG: hypothetical protein CMM07_10450 [Rhodopirellula sp.]|nr:hypothetical protein [Rhodopirellula sp.]